ncbi:MAG TPA: nuclear transport factor 2 family protein [Acidimicrobiia bacterium]
MKVVEQYLAAIVGHDWDGLRECVTDDVVRVGPYGDRYEGRDAYVAFLAATMPSLRGYEMVVDRVTYTGEGRAFAELSETVEIDGRPVRTPEVLVFDLAPDGRITHVEIYIQTAPPS